MSASVRVKDPEAWKLCTQIAQQDRSNLFVVSQQLRDRGRYEAFITLYAVMRVIDDLVDSVADVSSPTGFVEREECSQKLAEWRGRIRRAYEGNPWAEPLDVALAAVLRGFPLPFEIWSRFLDAMDYDLAHDRFANDEDFLDYAEGATVAPTTVYVFLLTAEPDESPPTDKCRYGVSDIGDGFDYQACGRALGTFAYLGHIIRDVVADLKVGTRGRIYIPLSDIAAAGFSEDEFVSVVRSGIADERWFELVRVLCRRAHHFEHVGVELARKRFPAMDPDCRFVLDWIIRLYQDLLGRIESRPEAVLTGETIQHESHRETLLIESAKQVGLPWMVGGRAKLAGDWR